MLIYNNNNNNNNNKNNNNNNNNNSDEIQHYSVCFLTGHVFKRVQWDDVNSMKIISRNISRPLNLAYRCQAQSYSQERLFSMLANWYSNNVSWPCTVRPAN